MERVEKLLGGLGKYLPAIVVGIDAFLCILIIMKIAYTEIDWIAYMQEVEGNAISKLLQK